MEHQFRPACAATCAAIVLRFGRRMRRPAAARRAAAKRPPQAWSLADNQPARRLDRAVDLGAFVRRAADENAACRGRRSCAGQLFEQCGKRRRCYSASGSTAAAPITCKASLPA